MSQPSSTSVDPAELGAPLGPIGSAERISSLDTLRGFALFGILLMNIIGFGLPYAYEDPTNYGGAEGANLIAWAVNNLAVEGTMRALFSMLFGAGVVLLTSRAEQRGGGIEIADIYYRRTLLLLAFGVIHAYLLLWPGEILYYYGLVGLFLFPLRKVSPRMLIVAGLLVLATMAPRSLAGLEELRQMQTDALEAKALQTAGETLTEEQQDAIDDWRKRFEEKKPTEIKLQKTIDNMRSGYVTILEQITPEIIYWHSKGTYLIMFWDVLGMMLIGMALLKLGVLTASRSYLFYVLMGLIGYAIGLSVNAFETRMLIERDFEFFAIQESYVTYELGRLPMALGHLSVVMIVCKAAALRWLTVRLGAVGRMALTNYVMHTVICALFFYGIGLGFFGQLQRYQLYYVVLAIWILQLIVSPIWLKHYRFGPLEWGWRYLTYGERPPLRRPL